MINKDSLLLELENLPKGYISKKIIHGKTYFYLQYKDGNKLISKYIKGNDLEALKALLKRREELIELLKKEEAKEKPLNHLSKRTLELSGYVMSEDNIVAFFEKGNLVYINENAPLIVKKNKDLVAFLSSRVMDTSRTNARLLKRVLDIHGEEDYLIALKNHATSVTDNYWFKSKGSRLKYKDVSLESDIYNEISLKGELSYYPHQGKLSPQFSLLGSLEKCWKLIDKKWWMYKAESLEERESELISSRISAALNIPTAYYELEDKYIKTLNFASEYNYEHLASIAGDDDSYLHVYQTLKDIDIELVKQYLKLIWFDALVNNVDRHNENIGLLRDKKLGTIISLAPNFDLNMSLYAKDHKLEKRQQGLLSYFLNFVKTNKEIKDLYKSIKFPVIDEEIIDGCLMGIEDKYDVKGYILYRYEILKKLL